MNTDTRAAAKLGRAWTGRDVTVQHHIYIIQVTCLLIDYSYPRYWRIWRVITDSLAALWKTSPSCVAFLLRSFACDIGAWYSILLINTTRVMAIMQRGHWMHMGGMKARDSHGYCWSLLIDNATSPSNHEVDEMMDCRLTAS